MNIHQLKKLFFKNQHLSQIIFKNTSWMILANIISKAFKFWLIVMIARELGPGLFGNFNYIIVLSGICFILSDNGLNLLIIREFQENKTPHKTLIATGFSIKLILICINILFAFACYFLIDSILRVPFIIFSIMNIIDGIKQYWITLNRAHLKQEIEGIGFIIETSVTSILGIMIVIHTKSLIALAAAYLLGSFLASIYLYVKTSTLMCPIKNTNKKLLKQLLKTMAPFTISIFLATAITSVDTLMIQWILNSEAVGYYNTGLKISETIIMIPAIFSIVIFPFLSKYYNQPTRIHKIAQESLTILFMIGCPICFGGIYLAQNIITTIFSINYISGTATFQYLLGATLLLFWYIPINGFLLATKHEIKCIKNSSIGCLVNIVINSLLIPIFGIVGAGIGTLIGRAILLKLHISTFKKEFPDITLILNRNFTYIILSIFMLGSIMLCKSFTSNLFLLIGSGIISYLILLRAIKDPSIKKIKEILSINELN